MLLLACGNNNGSGSNADAGATAACLGGMPGAPGESGLPCAGMPAPGANTSASTAIPLPSSECGALSASASQAWFSLPAQAGTWIAVAVNASGDAVFTLRAPDGSATPLQGKQVVCGASAGPYLLEVSSPAHAAQDYSIHWQ